VRSSEPTTPGESRLGGLAIVLCCVAVLAGGAVITLSILHADQHQNRVTDAAHQPIIGWLTLSAGVCLLAIPVAFVLLYRSFRRAQRTARQAHRRLTDLTNASHEGIVLCGKDGRIKACNPAAAAMFDHTVDTLRGQSLSDLPLPIATGGAASGSLAAPEFERVAFTRWDGQPRVFEVAQCTDGHLGLVLLLRDITQQDARFHEVARATNDIIYDADLAADRVWVNNRFFELIPEARGSVFTQATWSDHIHPEDRDHVLRSFEQAIDDPAAKLWSCTYRFARDGDEWLNVLDRGSIRRDKKGRAIRIIGAMTDLTELRRQEQELRASEQRFRDLFERSPDAILVLTPGGVVLDANSPACALFDASRDQLVGDAITDYVTPQQIDKTRRALPELMDGTRDSLELTLPVGNSSVVVEVRAGSIHYGKAQALLMHLRDITARREAQRALRASEWRYKNVVETQAELVCRFDPELTLTFANYAFCRLFGVAREDVIGTPLLELLPPAAQQRTKECVKRLKEQTLPDGAACHMDDANQRSPVEPEPLSFSMIDGRHTLWVEWSSHPIFDARGRLTEVQAVGRDVTRLKESQRQRVELENELRQAQKIEALGTLASGIAHDFNNLLTAINGYTELAKRQVADDHKVRAALDMIDKASEQASDVTRALLTFAQKAPSTKGPTDLCRVAEQSIKLLRRLLPANIELVQQFDPQPVWSLADPTQVQQVLLNLAINARDAMPDGGTLRISVGNDRCLLTAGDDHAPPGYNGRRSILAVEDTGVGMQPAMIQRVFEPFFTTKTRGEGTGLGLSMVHGIIREHEGEIDVQSTPGVGTRMTVFLPRCAPAPDGQPVEEADAPEAAHRGHVLLAEDNDHVRDIMRSALEDAGFSVVACADGEAAMRSFAEHRQTLDAVLLDLDLPRRSGLSCLTELRNQAPSLPVIIATGHPQQYQQEHAPPGETLMIKPFKMKALISVIADRTSPQPRETH